MTDEEIETIGRLADMCRRHGVKSIDVGGCKMELLPKEDTSAPAAKATDSELCRCGHPMYAHMNGLCTVSGGCDPSKCIDEEARA